MVAEYCSERIGLNTLVLTSLLYNRDYNKEDFDSYLVLWAEWPYAQIRS